MKQRDIFTDLLNPSFTKASRQFSLREKEISKKYDDPNQHRDIKRRFLCTSINLVVSLQALHDYISFCRTQYEDASSIQLQRIWTNLYGTSTDSWKSYTLGNITNSAIERIEAARLVYTVPISQMVKVVGKEFGRVAAANIGIDIDLPGPEDLPTPNNKVNVNPKKILNCFGTIKRLMRIGDVTTSGEEGSRDLFAIDGYSMRLLKFSLQTRAILEFERMTFKCARNIDTFSEPSMKEVKKEAVDYVVKQVKRLCDGQELETEIFPSTSRLSLKN